MSNDETAPEMLARLGTDAMLWAQEFNKTAVKLGYSEMDEGWLIGWFSNAIENCDVVRCNPIRADFAAVTEERDRLREAVKRADSYIHNGIELGFIRHCDTPEDPAYHTPRIVREAARAALEGVMEPPR